MKPTTKTPVIAEQWQLALLKKSYRARPSPTEEQRHALVAETGLDESWIRNWFSKQSVKKSTRNRYLPPATIQPRKTRPSASTSKPFILYLPSTMDPPALSQVDSNTLPYPQTSDFTVLESKRSVPSAFSTSEGRYPIGGSQCTTAAELDDAHRPVIQSPIIDYIPAASPDDLFGRSPSPSECPSNARSSQSSETSTRLTYSRDPLHNRYPDFSQFFLPKVSGNPCNSVTYYPDTVHTRLSPTNNSTPETSGVPIQHPSTSAFTLPRPGYLQLALPPISYTVRASELFTVNMGIRESHNQTFVVHGESLSPGGSSSEQAS
ncbi:hypothetical protein BV22DRAFT_1031389 [Leucogyrophana mollusca]|uniref:Uncharacterized protein n=1 Tax=Leucogyrophana mollusca TaxID=85980 RepID=A0ACB8BR81_9AGAM|nr:hypothetical protein BV22DRAFT_1031389 [Leucogyrophana mollusca]